MAKITFEWDKDIRGNEILLATKTRGKITIPELQEALRKDYRYQGSGWAITFKVFEDGGYIGWGDAEDPKGDILELYRIDEYDECPICRKLLSPIEYCNHCGEKLAQEGGDGA